MGSAFIISILAMGGLGIFFAVCIVIAEKKLRVEENPMVEKILAVLPQTNCGACGYPGCHALAEKLAAKGVPLNTCVAGGQMVIDALSEVMGVASMKAKRILAVVLCRGGDAEAEKDSVYRGDRTCAAANLTGGEKTCAYSCLGYADCVKACNYDAMEMNDNGLPVVFYDKCIGCGACEKACPRDIIEMHPEDHKLFVYCRNKDKGAYAKKICKVSCIACSLCVKDCKVEGGITLIDNLATIAYEKCPQDSEPIKRCPTECILYGEEEKSTSEKFHLAYFKKVSGG